MTKFNTEDLQESEKARLNGFVSDTQFLQDYRDGDEWLILNGFLGWAGTINPELLKLTAKGIRAVLDLAEIRAVELAERAKRKQGAAIATELYSGRVELNMRGLITYVDNMQEARENANKAGIRLNEVLR